jgi:hypothetical protein
MSAERLTLFMEIKMLTRVFAASIAVMALAAPSAALAEDAVSGAIVGAITGAAIATGAVVPYERREPLREYIVRESRPSIVTTTRSWWAASYLVARTSLMKCQRNTFRVGITMLSSMIGL